MRVGDVITMGKFDMVTERMTLSFRKPSRTEVYVFMFLGVERKDGSAPLDLEMVMKQLGWKPVEDK